MLAEQMRQDQIANDLANASTPGYKADRTTQQAFGEPAAHQLRHRRSRSARRRTGASGHRHGHRLDARSALKDTGEPLDFAIDGDGFFAVQTGQGTRYTRNGQFSADAQGRS